MRILFFAPSAYSSGEAVTAVNCAHALAAVGATIHFVVSEFTAQCVPPEFPRTVLSFDAEANFVAWTATVVAFRPTLIWFVDFEQSFFTYGQTVPLGSPDWLRSVEALDADLATFDHIGVSHGGMSLTYGQPPRSRAEHVPSLPARAVRYLPCPVQNPLADDGVPFRIDGLRYNDSEREEIRTSLIGDGLLIAHFVPVWVERLSHLAGSYYYKTWTEWFEEIARRVEVPITVVSVNSGSLLSTTTPVKNLRVVNCSIPGDDERTRLLTAANLVLSENAVSTTVGKAIMAGVPAVVIRAGGLDVFPIWTAAQLREQNNFPSPLYESALTIMDRDEAEVRIPALLTDEDCYLQHCLKQEPYAEVVDNLPTIDEIFTDA